MTKLNKRFCVLFFCLAAACAAPSLHAGDWPMWRHDASHSAYTPDPLSSQLHLQWTRKLPMPLPAWPLHQYKLQFDLSYEPVAAGKMLLVPSMVTDSITAYDTEAGVEKWRFYCEGPVRFAPVAWRGKVYFASDDGYLYCLQTADGALQWKFRGGPTDRKVLGNDRLISTWSARGAPVIYDGIVYFAAGIWPFMGAFIHALEAETGEVVWTNSAAGPMFIRQPHNDPAFSGVAPQGYIAASPGTLLVTGGRARPAAFDRRTGQFRYFKHADNAFGKFRGGYDIAMWKDWFFNFDVMYRTRDGSAVAAASAAVAGPDAIIGFHQDGSLMAYVPTDGGKARGLWKSAVPPGVDKIHLQAGPRLYCSGPNGLIAAIDVPDPGDQAKVSWQGKVEGTVFTMLSADEKIFVVTTAGAIYCFGSQPVRPEYHELILSSLPAAPGDRCEEVAAVLEESSANEGCCLLLGVGSGEMLCELLRQSKLHVIVLEPDVDKVIEWRGKLAAAGLHGTRAALVTGDIETVELPLYFASLALAEEPLDDKIQSCANLTRLFNSLRPYGGSAFLPAEPRAARRYMRGEWTSHEMSPHIEQLVHDADLPNIKTTCGGGFMRMTRAGALPGSADWTHQYGDIANTVCSEDLLVKAPLGLLWFGERTDFGDVLPRHGHGPPEQVVAGRLFIEGLASIAARDVYTGRTLWKTPLEGLNAYNVYYDGTFVDDFRDTTYNQVHIAGANARGANFVATADRVYVIQDRACAVLDAATGQVVNRLAVPDPLSGEPAEWAYIGVYEDYLIAGAGFAEYSRLIGPDAGWLKWTRYADRLASKGLVVMNRHTGKILWSHTARFGLPHNAIAVGAKKVFCMDLLPPFALKPTAETADDRSARLLALDVRNGRVRWQKTGDVFGGWLGYSAAHDILVQGDWPEGDDMGPWKNFDRIIARRGKNGRTLWDEPITYNGPYILCDDRIITQRSQGKTARAFSLLTGEVIMRKHPLTGESVPWEYMRLKGCNTAIGARNLITFRSSAAGYFDLANDGGTGNLGGFKSGCTSNLIAANGVLNAPDYTQTCTCSYQNQTSLAFVPMPAADIWTFNTIQASDKPILRLGVNFGAPGDRMADNGTLWLDYPSVGGRSPEVGIETRGDIRWYRYDSSRITSGPLPWVTASGAEGIEEIRIRLASEDDYENLYTVRLYFAEPEQAGAQGRTFDVTLDGRPVLAKFDPAAAAGGRGGTVREFTGVLLKKEFKVGLTAIKGETLICGIEIVAESSTADSGVPKERNDAKVEN